MKQRQEVDDVLSSSDEEAQKVEKDESSDSDDSNLGEKLFGKKVEAIDM